MDVDNSQDSAVLPEEPMSQDVFSQGEVEDLSKTPEKSTEPLNSTPGEDKTTAEPSINTRTGFPDTIEGFGYRFNDEHQLRCIKTGVPYNFNYKEDDKEYNQKRYNALGELIEHYIYNLLEKDEKLEKVIVPLNAKKSAGKSFIFLSDGWNQKEKLLLLIHGSGVVRAGQWARRLIINDSLKSGTQIPYIQRAKEEGYGIIVLNPNQNVDVKDGVTPVKGSSSPEEHFLYVWDHFVMKAGSQHVGIVAHSYGGAITLNGLKERTSLMKKVFGVAFTDSVHQLTYQLQAKEREKLGPWFREYCQNWVSSPKALDTPLKSFNKNDCPLVSAGTQSHSETSPKAINSVFVYLGEMFKKAVEKSIVSEEKKSKTEL